MSARLHWREPKTSNISFFLRTSSWNDLTLLGQWLNFKLFGITYLVGKIQFKLFFSGSIGWVSYKSGRHSIIVLRTQVGQVPNESFWVLRCWPDSPNWCSVGVTLCPFYSLTISEDWANWHRDAKVFKKKRLIFAAFLGRDVLKMSIFLWYSRRYSIRVVSLHI